MRKAPKELTVNHKELGALSFEIASVASQISDRRQYIDYGVLDDVLLALLDAQDQVARMGWLADRISMRCGCLQVNGGAEEWLLPPRARSSERVGEEAV